MSWSWIFYLSSGIVATVVTAHLMCKPRQASSPEPPEQKPVPSANNIEINVYPLLYPSSLYPFPFVIPESDPDLARQLDELERRIEENKYRSASPVVDRRRLEYVRYLVDTGRLTEDL